MPNSHENSTRKRVYLRASQRKRDGEGAGLLGQFYRDRLQAAGEDKIRRIQMIRIDCQRLFKAK